MRWLRLTHRWLGLALALPLLIQGLSGMVLTLEPVWPAMGARVAAAPEVPASAVIEAARPAGPQGARLGRYVPAADGAPAEVVFTLGGGPRGPGVSVQVDPARLQPIGPARPTGGGVIGWVRRLHDSLLLPAYGGRQIAGWFGVGLLLLTLIGIPLWWPRPGRGGWRAALSVPARARGARLQRALHGAIAGWMVLMLLATSLTGIVQGFPRTARAVLGLGGAGGRDGPPNPVPDRRAQVGSGVGRAPAEPVDIDAVIRAARSASPGSEVRAVLFPAAAHEPIRLMLAPPGKEGAVVTRFVAVDGASGRVVASQPQRLPWNEMVMRWAHDLHEGAGLGPVWRLLTVLVGAAVPALGITGWLLWLVKRANRARVRRAATAAAE